jgi:hypothetical protein
MDDDDRGTRYGEVQRAQLRIEKQFGKLTSGEIGLSIDDGERIMSRLQEFVVKQELATYAQARRVCPSCERLRPVKDYTIRKIRTVFGTVEVKNTIYHRVLSSRSHRQNPPCGHRRRNAGSAHMARNAIGF